MSMNAECFIPSILSLHLRLTCLILLILFLFFKCSKPNSSLFSLLSYH